MARQTMWPISFKFERLPEPKRVHERYASEVQSIVHRGFVSLVFLRDLDWRSFEFVLARERHF